MTGESERVTARESSIWDAHRTRRARRCKARVVEEIPAQRDGPVAPLPDGDYDAFIVWAERRDDALVFELTLTTGTDKGALFSVAAAIETDADPIALVGLPCTLSVRDARPRVRL